MMGRSHSTLRVLAAGIVGAMLVAGCSAPEEVPDPERAVHSVNTPLEEVEIDQLALPYAFQELPAYDLPFDDVPLSADGILFGLQEVEGVLEFSAVTVDGELLWSTQRPATCSGFTLSRVGETPLVILTDVESNSEALAQVTASAYDLRSGELRWGPVPVDGPWQGPGTVFAEAAPASAMGEVGPRQVLDPATGEELETGDAAVVGEFDGTILTIADGPGGTLTATGGNVWDTPIGELTTDPPAEPGDVTQLPGVSNPPGYALLSVDASPEAAIVDLTDGEVLSTSATSATWDPAAEILIATEPAMLAGYSAHGPAWNRGLAEGLTISASGGVLTYLRSDTSVQVVNAVTGEDAVGYDPKATSYAVPALITATGAAVFRFDSLVLVGTHSSP